MDERRRLGSVGKVGDGDRLLVHVHANAGPVDIAPGYKRSSAVIAKSLAPNISTEKGGSAELAVSMRL